MSSIQVGLAIASKKPRKLSEFYVFATEGDLLSGFNQDHFLVVNCNGMTIEVYRPSEKEFWSDLGRASALCLKQEPSSQPLLSLNHWASSLIAKGANLISHPKIESFGVEAWMTDPEGNYFLIFIPNNEERSI